MVVVMAQVPWALPLSRAQAFPSHLPVQRERGIGVLQEDWKN